MIYTGPNQKNIKKYGKNFPYKAWLPNMTEDVTPNENSSVIYKCYGMPKTVYSGRFCAVSGFIFAIVKGKYSVLVNKRGNGTPDYQGYWNCPCGFLEIYENSKEGIAREILEECGFQIDLDDLKVIYVETEPKECNNGNVTIRHKAFLGKIAPHYVTREGGEENEVSDIRWIPVEDIGAYKFAFNHYNTIKNLLPSKFKIKIIEWYYKIFKTYNKKYS